MILKKSQSFAFIFGPDIYYIFVLCLKKNIHLFIRENLTN